MGNQITSGVLQQIAGDIEKLLVESQEGINFSYHKIDDGIKLSISVDLVPSSKGIATEYTMSYHVLSAGTQTRSSTETKNIAKESY